MGLKCSFCGSHQRDVDEVFASMEGIICCECVDLFKDIMKSGPEVKGLLSGPSENGGVRLYQMLIGLVFVQTINGLFRLRHDTDLRGEDIREGVLHHYYEAAAQLERLEGSHADYMQHLRIIVQGIAGNDFQLILELNDFLKQG